MSKDYSLWKTKSNYKADELIDSFETLSEVYKYIYEFQSACGYKYPYLREWPDEEGIIIDYGSRRSFLKLIRK